MPMKPFSVYFLLCNQMPQVVSRITKSLFLAQEYRTRNRPSRISSTTTHVPLRCYLLAPACDVLLACQSISFSTTVAESAVLTTEATACLPLQTSLSSSASQVEVAEACRRLCCRKNGHIEAGSHCRISRRPKTMRRKKKRTSSRMNCAYCGYFGAVGTVARMRLSRHMRT